MTRATAHVVLVGFLLIMAVLPVAAQDVDADRDILLTFDNTGARASATAWAAPYRFRKRYVVTPAVRRLSRLVAKDHNLVAVDHWPIRSLAVYCFVYRVPEGVDRDQLVAALSRDSRVESAQPLNEFAPQSKDSREYNDPYASMQHGLQSLALTSAHRNSTGRGVRIAIVDSHADVEHEDLKGRIRRMDVFSGNGVSVDSEHGTAVASIIGARSNNALGIVGVAPHATLDVLVSCWQEEQGVICDSFSLAKALDRMLDDPPEVVNLSLAGPDDGLIRRLLQKAIDAGVVVVASQPSDEVPDKSFPASMHGVVGVASSVGNAHAVSSGETNRLYAPGEQIMVAVPDNRYDFRSGSSLAAAHVSGVIALILSVSPDVTTPALMDILRQSQVGDGAVLSVNAFTAVQLAHTAIGRVGVP